MSALLTTTMPAMRTTIEALRAAGVRNQVKVFIGGAPITQQYADDIGADGYSENAVGAVTLAKKAVAP
jgi:5-methyltetrahydrofolate--homocysteine methyltransferase